MTCLKKMLQVLQVGMQVLIENTKEKICKGDKLSQRWLGDLHILSKELLEKACMNWQHQQAEYSRPGRLKVCFYE